MGILAFGKSYIKPALQHFSLCGFLLRINLTPVTNKISKQEIFIYFLICFFKKVRVKRQNFYRNNPACMG
ncbi:hypothetical protein, partial [Phascolarctobacterium faecium]|uniref:hypothetical protein n=1 Tax=Phascolarctobacterium faecium TaxID=33025 RepID=UPI003FD7ED33